MATFNSMHKSTVMASLNVIAQNYYPRYCKLKKIVRFETRLVTMNEGQGHGTSNGHETFRRTIFTANLMAIARTVSEIIDHLLFS